MKVKTVTEEEWLRGVQRMSRKELIALCIEQHKENHRLFETQTHLLRDVAYARRTIGEQWIPSYCKYKQE